jgi:hypothetical protein
VDCGVDADDAPFADPRACALAAAEPTANNAASKARAQIGLADLRKETQLG